MRVEYIYLYRELGLFYLVSPLLQETELQACEILMHAQESWSLDIAKPLFVATDLKGEN